MIEKLIIGAPFGNYLKFPGATPTLGTFTLKRRGGMAYRLWRCLRTLRYSRRMQAWINKLGLPNPGIDSVQFGDYYDKIISVFGFNKNEWDTLASRLSLLNIGAVELNLSCPNISHSTLAQDVKQATLMLSTTTEVIAKLPPVRWMELAKPLFDIGVRWFHCCNTIPTPGGGISGKPLKQYSLWATEEIKDRWGTQVKVTSGGGISRVKDIMDYEKAGADHFAVGSLLLNPFRWRKIKVFNTYLKMIGPL